MTTVLEKDQIYLTPLQNQAVQKIIDWSKSNKQCFVLAGYAGTGKTTLANRISQKLGGVFCSYTAKAASVLQSKGVNACTIHSLMYNYEGQNEQTGELIWSLKNKDSESFLIVDEYSMLDRKTIEDLCNSFPKILFLGDPMQLPPIREGKQVLEPDFLLNEIHRQAETNPIIMRSKQIREGTLPLGFINDENIFVVKNAKDLTKKELLDADQIIVGKNKTRRVINQKIRELLGYSDLGNIPVRGDKLIIKQNNRDLGLVNGHQFTCERNAFDWNMDNNIFKMQLNNDIYKFWDLDILGADSKTIPYKKDIQRVDFGYAITCHAAQGSEYDNVIVIDESWGSEKDNWLYTAVTRAKKKVTIIKGYK